MADQADGAVEQLMASTINASNTGPGGLIYTADASGALQIQAAGINTIVVNSTSVAVANSISFSYGGVSLSNSVTGTGSMVLATGPTISSPILTGNTSTSNLIVNTAAALTYGGVALSNSVTGTGSMVLSAAPTLTGQATFNGSTSALAAVLASAGENVNVTSTAANGTINYDVNSQNVLYFTANSTGNWTVNFRGSSGTTLNNTLAIGQAVTAAHLVTQGATAYYNSLVQVDGANTTAKWQGGTAPTAGNASSVDGYIYTIVKTANTTFSVFAGLTQYK